MKTRNILRLAIIVIALMAGISSRAQDTIRHSDGQYLYPYPYPNVQIIGYGNSGWGQSGASILPVWSSNYRNRHYTITSSVSTMICPIFCPTKEVTIYGIAAPIWGASLTRLRQENSSPIQKSSSITTKFDLPQLPYYFVLFQKVNGSWQPTDSILVNPYTPTKYFEFSYTYEAGTTVAIGDSLVFTPGDYHAYPPIQEGYFSHPITLLDSFFVGIFPTVSYPYFTADIWPAGVFEVTPRSPYGILTHNYPTVYQYQMSMCYDTDTIVACLLNDEIAWWGGVMPILVPQVVDQVSCVRGERPHIFSQGEDYVSLQWDAYSEHDVWQISVGPADQHPDSNTIVDSWTALKTIADLDTITHYAAYVRGRCHHACPAHDTLLFGDWGDSICFFLGTEIEDDITDVGISAPAALGLSVSPNPVRHTLKVRTSADVQGSLEVYNAEGQRLQSSPIEGREARLDVSRLPSGQYLLRLRTRESTSSAKFVKR